MKIKETVLREKINRILNESKLRRDGTKEAIVDELMMADSDNTYRLGKLGELLVRTIYEDAIDLNDIQRNFPFADIALGSKQNLGLSKFYSVKATSSEKPGASTSNSPVKTSSVSNLLNVFLKKEIEEKSISEITLGVITIEPVAPFKPESFSGFSGPGRNPVVVFKNKTLQDFRKYTGEKYFSDVPGETPLVEVEYKGKKIFLPGSKSRLPKNLQKDRVIFYLECLPDNLSQYYVSIKKYEKSFPIRTSASSEKYFADGMPSNKLLRYTSELTAVFGEPDQIEKIRSDVRLEELLYPDQGSTSSQLSLLSNIKTSKRDVRVGLLQRFERDLPFLDNEQLKKILALIQDEIRVKQLSESSRSFLKKIVKVIDKSKLTYEM
jgi:hypothetical protein